MRLWKEDLNHGMFADHNEGACSVAVGFTRFVEVAS